MNNFHYLIFDTSAEICSVALCFNNEVVVSKESVELNSHAEKLTLLIEECMMEGGVEFKNLAAICIHKGPGSYTGLRIGSSVAKGICYAWNIPLVALDGINGYAHHFNLHSDIEYDNLMVAIDARRSEVYATVLNKNSLCVLETTPIIIDQKFNDFLAGLGKIVVLSNCQEKLKMLMNVKNIIFKEDNILMARNLMDIAYNKVLNKTFENLTYFEPNYIKNSYIKTN